MTICLLLPAYNEAKALPDLLNRVSRSFQGQQLSVIVIDDGSSDRTAEIAAGCGVLLLRHEKNQGLGAALRTGFGHIAAQAADNDVVVTMDADDTHDPALVGKMLPLLGEHEIVIASRYCRGGKQTGVGLARALLSRLMSRVLGLVFPVAGATDYSSGYRAYRAGLIKSAARRYGAQLIESPGFACMPELLVKMAALGARVAEVPLVMHYEQKKSGSKFQPWALVLGYLRLFLLLKRALARLKS